jgi:hypothetical protein
MKNAFCLLLACITLNCFSQERQAKHKIESNLSISFNTNGIASIPAFSLGKPAVIAGANISKGRFSYDPVLAYSLEMKPWFIDNWLHYKIIDSRKFELKAGVNFSTFCQEVNINGTEFVKAERYFAFSLSPSYKFSATSSVIFDYWSDNGQEKGSISGHFISLAYDKSDIPLGKILFSFNVMLFQLLYDGNNDGLFISPKFSLSVRNIPLDLFFQATQEIRSNITPSPGFRWNTGISYSL